MLRIGWAELAPGLGRVRLRRDHPVLPAPLQAAEPPAELPKPAGPAFLRQEHERGLHEQSGPAESAGEPAEAGHAPGAVLLVDQDVVLPVAHSLPEDAAQVMSMADAHHRV